MSSLELLLERYFYFFQLCSNLCVPFKAFLIPRHFYFKWAYFFYGGVWFKSSFLLHSRVYFSFVDDLESRGHFVVVMAVECCQKAEADR